MEARTLEIGGIYRHFKNKLYQVKCIAYHSETKEKMVVYQALYGDFSVYVRPYEMFISEVDSIKYPEATQKYRFEQVRLSEAGMPHAVCQKAAGDMPDEQQQITEGEQAPEQDAAQADAVDSRLMMFLDAESYQEKLNVLAALQSKLDDKLIDAMAASMEIEVPEGDMRMRYTSLRNCIYTHAKYECTRLR